MYALSIITAATSLICVIIGVFVFRQDRKPVNRIFMLLCVSSIIFTFPASILFMSHNRTVIMLCFKTAITGLTLIEGFNLHFYVELTNFPAKRWMIALIYLPVVVFITIFLGFDSEFAEIIRYDPATLLRPNYHNTTLLLFVVFVSLYGILFLTLLIRWGLRSHNRKVKLQARTIVSVSIVASLLCEIFDFILPIFGLYSFHFLTSVIVSIYIGSICYVLLRFRFLTVKPSLVADEIISNIQEMVIFLNPQLEVMTVNKSAAEQLACGKNNLSGKSIDSITSMSEAVREMIRKLTEGKINNSNFRLTYTSAGAIVTDTYCSRIVDKFGDYAGLLLISKENKGIRHFQKTYNLTERQIEIIEHAVAGLSNREISEKLGLSLKTTESHFSHIFDRLGINSRMELFVIAKDYTIISTIPSIIPTE